MVILPDMSATTSAVDTSTVRWRPKNAVRKLAALVSLLTGSFNEVKMAASRRMGRCVVGYGNARAWAIFPGGNLGTNLGRNAGMRSKVMIAEVAAMRKEVSLL